MISQVTRPIFLIRKTLNFSTPASNADLARIQNIVWYDYACFPACGPFPKTSLGGFLFTAITSVPASLVYRLTPTTISYQSSVCLSLLLDASRFSKNLNTLAFLLHSAFFPLPTIGAWSWMSAWDTRMSLWSGERLGIQVSWVNGSMLVMCNTQSTMLMRQSYTLVLRLSSRILSRLEKNRRGQFRRIFSADIEDNPLLPTLPLTNS